MTVYTVVIAYDFYSRASCEARLCKRLSGEVTPKISTHAPHARRGTIINRLLTYIRNFYSRASCEARRQEKMSNTAHQRISTHAPHARRGPGLTPITYHDHISTHAPHARRG